METTNQFLDAVKEKHGLGSDYALAAKLGITRSMVSAYRTGKRMLGDDTAVKVAELLNVDPGYILASIEAERTHSDAARAAWEKLAELVKRHGVAAALLILVAAPAISPTPTSAAPMPGKAGAGVCILCQLRRAVGWVCSSLAPWCRFCGDAAALI